MGGEFPFPIDIKNQPIITRVIEYQGNQTMTHVEAEFYLFHKQWDLLQILHKEQREHHRELKTKEEAVLHQENWVECRGSK